MSTAEPDEHRAEMMRDRGGKRDEHREGNNLVKDYNFSNGLLTMVYE